MVKNSGLYALTTITSKSCCHDIPGGRKGAYANCISVLVYTQSEFVMSASFLPA